MFIAELQGYIHEETDLIDPNPIIIKETFYPSIKRVGSLSGVYSTEEGEVSTWE